MSILKRPLGNSDPKPPQGSALQSGDRTAPPALAPAQELAIPKGRFRFIALDVETASSFPGSICQVGLACVTQDGRIEGFGTYVDPQETFDYFNTRLHGIDAAKVAGAPVFPVVLAGLCTLLSSHRIVQHSNFDKSAFAAACKKYGLPPPAWTWTDSVQIARRAWPGLRGNGGHGLANLKSVLALDFDHHDAAEDARAAALVVLRAEETTGQSLEDLAAAAPRQNQAGQVVMAGNAAGPLAGNIAVFTGSLTIPRTEAAAMAAQAGITIAARITKTTTLLIAGDDDLSLRAGQEKSAKHRRAEELAAAGQPIRILGETEFRRLITIPPPRPALPSRPARRPPLTERPDWDSAKDAIRNWQGADIAGLVRSVHKISRLIQDEARQNPLPPQDARLIRQDTGQLARTLRRYVDDAELNDQATALIESLRDIADRLGALDDTICNLTIPEASDAGTGSAT